MVMKIPQQNAQLIRKLKKCIVASMNLYVFRGFHFFCGSKSSRLTWLGL